MKFLCLVFTLLCALSPFAATSKSASYNSGDDTVQALIYTPEGRGPFPGILVIHERWGLNDWVKEQLRRCLIRAMSRWPLIFIAAKSQPPVTRRTKACVACRTIALPAICTRPSSSSKSQSNVKKDRTSSIGWCRGGGYSFKVALQEPTLTADVINYGHQATDPESLKKINASILGIFGGRDRGIPVEDVKEV